MTYFQRDTLYNCNKVHKLRQSMHSITKSNSNDTTSKYPFQDQTKQQHRRDRATFTTHGEQSPICITVMKLQALIERKIEAKIALGIQIKHKTSKRKKKIVNAVRVLTKSIIIMLKDTENYYYIKIHTHTKHSRGYAPKNTTDLKGSMEHRLFATYENSSKRDCRSMLLQNIRNNHYFPLLSNQYIRIYRETQI